MLIGLDKKANRSKENRSCRTVNECSGVDVVFIGGAVDNEGKSDEIERERMMFINCSIITRTRISISYLHML